MDHRRGQRAEQIALGAVYAWSVFRIPLSRDYGWTVSQVTRAFELAILVLGFAAFLGGLWMKRSGPRPVLFLAAVLYGLGTVWRDCRITSPCSVSLMVYSPAPGWAWAISCRWHY